MGNEFSAEQASSAHAALLATAARLESMERSQAEQTQLLQTVLRERAHAPHGSGRERSQSDGNDYENWLHSADPYAMAANSSTRSMSTRSLLNDETSSTMSEDVHAFDEQLDVDDLMAEHAPLERELSADPSAEEFTDLLTPEQDAFYIKKHPVFAFQIGANATVTTSEEGWGTRTSGPGDWSIHNTTDGSMYTCSDEYFKANYEPVGLNAPNMFRKQRALARCMGAAFFVDVLENGQVQRYYGRKGDWLLQAHSDGQAPSAETTRWVIEADKFPDIYNLASAVSSHTRMLEGVVGVPDTSLLRRRSSMLNSVPSENVNEIAALLQTVDQWDFDIFAFNRLTNSAPLAKLAVYLCERHDLAMDLPLSLETLTSFFTQVEETYLPNPYHNALHGADVAQSTLHFIVRTGLAEHLSKLELMVAIIASACHDIGHPGTNNAFQVNANAKVAVRYNDISVLENFHAATTFKLMAQRECSVMRNFTLDDYRDARGKIIRMILATDLAKHKEHLVEFQERRLAGDLNWETPENRIMLLELCLKAADISHPAKPHEAHLRWTEACMQEFIDQGEKEKALGIPVTMNVDRTPAGIAGSQIGFIKFLVLPFYTEFSAFWGEFEWVSNVQNNLHSWQECKQHNALEGDFRLTRNVFKFLSHAKSGPASDTAADDAHVSAAPVPPSAPRTLSQTASMYARQRRQLDAL